MEDLPDAKTHATAISVAVARGSRRLVTQAGSLVDRALGKAWPSYALILLLQIKVIWRIWDIRDLTYGDTSRYFEGAKKWADGFLVDILWSPLYTAFYGSFLFVTTDPYNATILHRVVIVLVATIGVLLVLRQFLSPGLALLGAAWWAILPINYDTLYEVHLFAFLPILMAWALVLGRETSWARGAALAILAACTVLVRNEFSVAAFVMLVLCVVHERRCSQKITDLILPYGAPISAAIALCSLAYWRSTIKLPELWRFLDVKHTLNMCQVYAFGYQQRHPEWTANPWTECQGLARATFGVDYPSVVQMLWANPKAALGHFWWNLSLVPSGLELLLFNARAGNSDPDYAPSSVAGYPIVLGLSVIALLAAGAALAWRGRSKMSFSGMSDRIVIAFLPLLAMAVPVVLTQRPRPSYLFYVSVIVIGAVLGVTGLALRRWRRTGRSVETGAIILVGALVLVMPTYGLPPYLPSGRPALEKFEHLAPQRALLLKARGHVILGHWAQNIASYLDLNPGPETLGKRAKADDLIDPRTVFDSTLLRQWSGAAPVEQFLAEGGIEVLYLDSSELAWLRTQALAANMIGNPTSVGWRNLAHEERGDHSWALLARIQEKM